MSTTEKNVMRIVLKAPNPKSLATFVKDQRMRIVGCGGQKLLPDGTLSMEAYANEDVLDQLKKAGVVFDIIENASEVGKARRKEVGQGDRFEGGKRAPSGLGIAASVKSSDVMDRDTYYNVTEIESALESLANHYPGLTQLITLPFATYEGRKCHAIRIGTGNNGTKDAVLFIGGVHAGEWGSSEICINFATDVLEAYTQGTGLVYGGKSFPSARIKSIVEGLHIYVFPLVNPDGRYYSSIENPMWRKNRKLLYENIYGKFFGVDLNRNYDFVWDFPTFFSSSSHIESSTIGWASEYIGEEAFSEAETKNVRWMFDMNPRIKRFIDIHSYGELVLYPWGDDENQTSDPTMNFTNRAFDYTRGVAGDDYKEYGLTDDIKVISGIAARVRDAIQAVRGKNYTAKQSFYQYPKSGTSIDYAYSRHIVDPSKKKIYSFLIEWGTEHQPPWAEMENIILDVTAGLIEFCPTTLSPPIGPIIVR